MKHFHGTPIGGTRVAAGQFARGRFLLIPWKRPEALTIAMELSAGFMVDNSAYSFWKNSEKPQWHEYIKWCKAICRHPRFEFAIIPDVIDGDEQANDELIRLWDKLAWHPVYVRGVPVWHMHEPLSRLSRFSRYRTIAIGSSGEYATPGVGGWWERMDEAFKVLCDDDGYPKRRVHGLRMLKRSIVERYPFYSCDSTNAVQNGRREAVKHGINCPAYGQQLLADRIERSMSPSRFVPHHDQKYRLFESTGLA